MEDDGKIAAVPGAGAFEHAVAGAARHIGAGVPNIQAARPIGVAAEGDFGVPGAVLIAPNRLQAVVARVDGGLVSLGNVGAADAEVVVEGLEFTGTVVTVEEVVFGDEPTINNVVGGGGVGGRRGSGDGGKLETDNEDGSNGREGSRNTFLPQPARIKHEV